MSNLTYGDKVVKPKGYPYPGTVVAVFYTLEGNERIVVESELAPGMLHIFSPSQLMCPEKNPWIKEHDE